MPPQLRSAIGLGILACIVASCGGNSGAPIPAAPSIDRRAAAGAGPVVDFCGAQTPPPAPSPSSSPAGALAGSLPIKKPIRGLIDLGQVSADDIREPPYNTVFYVCRRAAAISGIVVNDTWANLQPVAGGPIHTAVIDRALRTIEQYDLAKKRTLGVRLRIWAGINAPAWAKSIGGPVAICDGDAVPATASPSARVNVPASPTPCPSPAVRTVGAFWSDAYEAAWGDVQRQLAKKYDNDPAVNEVSVSSCSSLTSEPFVQSEDAFSRDALINAGYTDARYQNCLAGAIKRDYAPAWRHTPVDYSFNPFREIDVTPPQTDLAFTESVIDGCRALIRARCVLLDEAMAKFTPPPSPLPSQTPSVAQSYYTMWNYMRARHGEITFQMAAPPNLLLAWGTNRAGWDAAVQLAHQFGASSLELFPQKHVGPCTTATILWVNGYSCFARSTLLGWKQELQ
jgi:hypothetical protein